MDGRIEVKIERDGKVVVNKTTTSDIFNACMKKSVFCLDYCVVFFARIIVSKII